MEWDIFRRNKLCTFPQVVLKTVNREENMNSGVHKIGEARAQLSAPSPLSSPAPVVTDSERLVSGATQQSELILLLSSRMMRLD